MQAQLKHMNVWAVVDQQALENLKLSCLKWFTTEAEAKTQDGTTEAAATQI